MAAMKVLEFYNPGSYPRVEVEKEIGVSRKIKVYPIHSKISTLHNNDNECAPLTMIR